VRSKLATLLAIVPAVLVLDLVTKWWAWTQLGFGQRIELFDGLVPLTLALNTGAAFGISVGDNSRWFFIPVTLVALLLLLSLFRQAAADDRLRHVSLSLVIAGAFGNLYDRVRWDRGVVDFIGPLDLGFYDFPIFNVADIAISCGAVLLAVSFWLEERRLKEEAAAASGVDAAPGPPAPGEPGEPGDVGKGSPIAEGAERS